jgi:hypothetical protein
MKKLIYPKKKNLKKTKKKIFFVVIFLFFKNLFCSYYWEQFKFLENLNESCSFSSNNFKKDVVNILNKRPNSYENIFNYYFEGFNEKKKNNFNFNQFPCFE